MNATIDVYENIREQMRPTPSRAHYMFNLRDVAKVIQGILQASPETINISVPKGFQIKNVTSNTTHLTLYIINDKGQDEVLIINLQTGKILRRYKFEIQK